METMLRSNESRAETTVANDPRWARIVARDRNADGLFWYSVVTTGVYCRPSCPSRTANPKNVRFHDTLSAAKAAGFRPCKRCNPDGDSAVDENTAIVARTCRMIEQSDEEPSLGDLAAAAGRSPSHFHRLFKSVTGLTPKEYAAAHRAAKVREKLQSGGSVTEAIYAAGFNSSSRFYEKSSKMLGMLPTHYRSGGANEELHFAVGECSLGSILVASSKKGVVSILLGDDPDELVRDLQDRFPKARLIGSDKDYETVVARAVGFVEAPGIGLDLPLDVRGTAFQQRVWRALQEDSGGANRVLRRDRAAHQRAKGDTRRGCGLAPRTTLRLPFLATASFARTDRCPVMPGASSARRRSWTVRKRRPAMSDLFATDGFYERLGPTRIDLPFRAVF